MPQSRLGRERRDGQHDARRVHTLAVRELAADVDLALDELVALLDDRHAHLAVVDEQRVAKCECREDLRMRQLDACLVAGRIVKVESEDVSLCDEHGLIVLEGAHAQLRPLQVGEHGDRVAMLRLERANAIDDLLLLFAHAVGEVDAENVDARDEELLHHFLRDRRRPKRRDLLRRFGPARASREQAGDVGLESARDSVVRGGAGSLGRRRMQVSRRAREERARRERRGGDAERE